MLSVQDDLAPASGILIGVSIGTAVWEVAIFIVWHLHILAFYVTSFRWGHGPAK